jgi:hypothetical protein
MLTRQLEAPGDEERLAVTGVSRGRSEGEQDLELACGRAKGAGSQLSRRQLARRQVGEGEEGRIEGSDESEVGGQCNGRSRSVSRQGMMEGEARRSARW